MCAYVCRAVAGMHFLIRQSSPLFGIDATLDAYNLLLLLWNSYL